MLKVSYSVLEFGASSPRLHVDCIIFLREGFRPSGSGIRMHFKDLVGGAVVGFRSSHRHLPPHSSSCDLSRAVFSTSTSQTSWIYSCWVTTRVLMLGNYEGAADPSCGKRFPGPFATGVSRVHSVNEVIGIPVVRDNTPEVQSINAVVAVHRVAHAQFEF